MITLREYLRRYGLFGKGSASTVRIGKQLSSLSRRQSLQGFLFIMPWIIGLVVFTAGPFIGGFVLSFTDYNGIQAPHWVGFQNYLKALQDPKFSLSILNTIYYVLLSVPLSTALALGLAMLLNQGVRGIAVFRAAFYVPAIVPTVPSVALLLFVLNSNFGLLNNVLASIGLPGPDWLTSPDWTKPALVLWTLWQSGNAMVIFLAGLQGVPQELHEAAAIDGAGVIKRFRHVTLPMISPTTFFVVTLQIISTFQVFTAAFILGSSFNYVAGAGPADSLLFWVLYIYQQGFYFFNMGYASALAWLLFVVIFIATLIQLRLAKRWVYYEADAATR